MQLQNITKIHKWSCNWPLHEQECSRKTIQIFCGKYL